jgi:ssDNA-binding Zn-finger/Zn-ribbon topoisomerase 1
MRDKTITCIQCDTPFVFTVEEQEEFEARGFDAPKRCPQCRKQKTHQISVTARPEHNGRRKGRWLKRQHYGY